MSKHRWYSVRYVEKFRGQKRGEDGHHLATFVTLNLMCPRNDSIGNSSTVETVEGIQKARFEPAPDSGIDLLFSLENPVAKLKDIKEIIRKTGEALDCSLQRGDDLDKLRIVEHDYTGRYYALMPDRNYTPKA